MGKMPTLEERIERLERRMSKVEQVTTPMTPLGPRPKTDAEIAEDSKSIAAAFAKAHEKMNGGK